MLAGSDPLRLRWFLNSIEDQGLAAERFEVLLSHRAEDDAMRALVRSHPLAAAGALRAAELPGTPTKAALLDAAWGQARGPAIVFAQARCWAPPGWLERCAATAARHPGLVVQGSVWSDPAEWRAKLAARHEALRVAPLEPLAGVTNSIWPREALVRLGGFAEGSPLPEAELMCRALRDGLGVAAPDLLLYSSPAEIGLGRSLSLAWRRRHLPPLAARHPGCDGGPGRRLFAPSSHPPQGLGGWTRAASRLPGRMLIGSTEALALAWGTAKAWGERR